MPERESSHNKSSICFTFPAVAVAEISQRWPFVPEVRQISILLSAFKASLIKAIQVGRASVQVGTCVAP